MQTTIEVLNLIKVGGIALLVILLGAYVFKSCNLIDENSKLHGIIAMKEEVLVKQEKETRLAKEVYEKNLREQETEILSWKKIADKNSEGMIVGNARVKELETQLANLNPAEKDAIILAQENLITTLKSNFTLACETIDAKNKIIDSWEIRFAKWEDYRVKLEKENFDLHGLNDAQESLVSMLEKDLRWTKAKGRIGNILLVGAAGFILYSMVKK